MTSAQASYQLVAHLVHFGICAPKPSSRSVISSLNSASLNDEYAGSGPLSRSRTVGRMLRLLTLALPTSAAGQRGPSVRDHVAMVRATRLPEIEIHDEGVSFELVAHGEALVELADAFSGEVLSIEVTPDDGSVVFVRVAVDGLVVISHEGSKVEVVGGRESLDGFAEWLRYIALGPEEGSEVRYHAHLEHYPGHPWLAADSDPLVVTLAD